MEYPNYTYFVFAICVNDHFKEKTIKYKWLIAIVSLVLAVIMPFIKVTTTGFQAHFLEAVLGGIFITG